MHVLGIGFGKSEVARTEGVEGVPSDGWVASGTIGAWRARRGRLSRKEQGGREPTEQHNCGTLQHAV